MITKPEISHPTPCCLEPSRWKCYDGDATEVEVLQFIQALVAALKPKTLIETGCYTGWGTDHIVTAISDYGDGHLWTTDIGHDMAIKTAERMKAFSHLVTVTTGSGIDLINQLPGPIDFAFLDSGPDEIRCHELRALHPKLAASGVVVIHDSGLQHGLRPHLIKTLRELGMQFIMLDTPRGVTIARKPWPDAI